MTMKIGSLLPVFVVAAFLGVDSVVYGDTGNLRGPLIQGTEQIESVAQVTIIQPSHNNLRNGTLESNEMTKRKRRRNHDTKDAGEKGQPYLLRGTIANAAANEVSAATNDDETTAKDKQNKHEEHKQKLAALDDEIFQIRQRIKESQEQLRAKINQQMIAAEDEQETLTAENEEEEEEEEEEEDLADPESDSDSDCGYYSFHRQSDGNSFRHPLAPTTPHSHETCRLTSNIIHKSEIHARALIGDGECHFDSIHGHWYQASCVFDNDDDDNDDEFRGNRKNQRRRRLPRFVFTKAFCSGGCESCADPQDLPGVHGRPEDDDDNGSIFRNFGRPAFAVCELPPTEGVEGNKKQRKKKKKKQWGKASAEASFVQYEGNCIRETCRDSFASTPTTTRTVH